ncbi:hypothetical protein COOONC_07044 [Cooperia oncophora]
MGTLKLFYEFLNEPLQWCDVRFDNLGLSADYPKRFVLMDGDMVYTESRLRAALQGRSCTTDADCTIGDCKARCTADLTCSDRTDSNLEVDFVFFFGDLVHVLDTHERLRLVKQLNTGERSQVFSLHGHKLGCFDGTRMA